MFDNSSPLHASWLLHLQAEFDKPYMRELSVFLRREITAGKQIYPAMDELFSAFNTSHLHDVSVVILGQDPYHGENQAHGLSFSVPKNVRIPPSLANIYKELIADIGIEKPPHGNLESWAKQGVLLLNSVLTVEQSCAASHQKKGWETFTDAVIQLIDRHCQNVVFLLWGSYAHKKGLNIDRNNHLVLTAPHPSPLSAHRGFIGCKHFSKTNQYLKEQGKQSIDWTIK